MAETSSSAPYTVQIGGLTNAQQQADGLPAYAIYANIPGSPPLPGPRTPGLSSVSTRERDSAGWVLGSSDDPAPPPRVGSVYGASPRFMVKPTKPMWEPSQFVPGTGWVNSAGS